jgi:hypothetical protein
MLTGGQALGRMGGNNARQQTQGQTRAATQVVVRNLWYIAGNGGLEVMRVAIGVSSGSFTEILALENEDIEGRQFILREKI